jgi:hypothetical protein
MKSMKQKFLVASILFVVLVSTSAFGQGVLSTADQSLAPDDSASLVPLSDILTTITPSQPGPILQILTSNPIQSPDNGGVSQSSVSNLSPTPVPEPSSFVLLTAGFVCAAILYRSRKNRSSRVSI